MQEAQGISLGLSMSDMYFNEKICTDEKNKSIVIHAVCNF